MTNYVLTFYLSYHLANTTETWGDADACCSVVYFFHNCAGDSRVTSEPADTQRDLSVVHEDVRLFPQEPRNLEGSFTNMLTVV